MAIGSRATRRRRRAPVVVLSAALALGIAPAPAGAHGAATGVHVHVEPDPAAPGDTVTVSLDADETMVVIRLAFVGADPVERSLEPPSRHADVALELPAVAGDARTVSLHVEVDTVSGRRLRQSAIVRIERSPQRAPSARSRLRSAAPFHSM